MKFIWKLLKRKTYYTDEVLEELNRELIAKSSAAAPGFFMVAVWITFQQFETIVLKDTIIFLGFCLMACSMIRYLISYLYKINYLEIGLAAKLTKINVLMNALLWSVTLMLPVYEYRFEHLISSIEVMSLVLGFTLSSMVSISYNIWVALFFQWILTVPLAAYLFYLSETYNNATAFHSGVVLIIVIVYMIQQTRRVHNQIVHRIQHALDLEFSNKLLLESQDLLIQEKVKLQHSIRLAAIGEISAEIAHEINNPLGIIMGYIELSLDLLRTPPPDVGVLENQLLKARSAITRIAKIIKGLRHYSRRTNDDPLVPVYVNEIIEDALEFCSEKFNYNKTSIEVENPGDFKLLCRPIEISQVLLNIFSNGIDEVAKLAPEERKMFLKVVIDGEHVRILISNRGPKIKTEIGHKLFEPFFSTKKIGIGTGLGLSISRGIIESYKGRLFYDPEFELTTFVVELPLHLTA